MITAKSYKFFRLRIIPVKKTVHSNHFLLKSELANKLAYVSELNNIGHKIMLKKNKCVKRVDAKLLVSKNGGANVLT